MITVNGIYGSSVCKLNCKKPPKWRGHGLCGNLVWHFNLYRLLQITLFVGRCPFPQGLCHLFTYTSSIKQSTVPAVGWGTWPTPGSSVPAGARLVWWPVTMGGYGAWHCWACWAAWQLGISSRGIFPPLLLWKSECSTSSCLTDFWSPGLCCWQGWGRGAACWCCSVRHGCWKASWANLYPLPLKLEIILCWQLTC